MHPVLVDKHHITEYIPHKQPIVMIDALLVCEGNLTTSSFKIEEDNLFVKDGRLHEPGIIENIAQTAAARAGYEVKKLGAAPLVGFIGAIKDLKIYELPKVGQTLETHVTKKTEVSSVTVIECVSF